jgi:PAS domain S-box-containing protein
VAPSQEAPGGFRLTLTDITARMQAEEALRESEERFHTLADNISQLVWIADTNGERFWYNHRWLNYTGMTTEEAQGWGWTKAHHPDHVDRVIKEFNRAWETGEPFEDTFPLRSKTGEYRWFLLRAVPIRDAEGKVVQWFGTNTDITERERMLSEEQRSREAAEAATRAKDEFLSVVSHELRTPLVPILGYLRQIRARPHDAEAVVRNCEIVERNARAQQQIIEDLLDSARIISGKFKLELAQADLRLVLEEAVEVVRPAAEVKLIDLTAQLDEAPRKMLCDALRLRQAVWNLLQNAIKFTPEGGRVALRVERNGRRVSLIVSDTGRGIEPDFLPAIFNRFSQKDMSNSRRHGGLGLGLSLSKQLIELHGGTIEAASAGAGQGATFTVTLPLNAPQAASYQTPAPAIAEISAGPAALPLENLPRLDGMRVLVVDDQEEARTLIADTLGEWGATVTVAASGREALELLEGEAFDALVCDIAMPEMDGYELLRRLRAMEPARGKRMPAIALTALARPEHRLQALRAGFRMHVAKPVELAELVMILASVVRSPKQE